MGWRKKEFSLRKKAHTTSLWRSRCGGWTCRHRRESAVRTWLPDWYGTKSCNTSIGFKTDLFHYLLLSLLFSLLLFYLYMDLFQHRSCFDWQRSSADRDCIVKGHWPKCIIVLIISFLFYFISFYDIQFNLISFNFDSFYLKKCIYFYFMRFDHSF